MTLDYETTSLMNGKEVVANIWSALKSCFEGKGLTAVAMLASKLWQYHIQTENDMSIQIQDMKNMALKLSSLSYPLSDEYQAMVVLQALPMTGIPSSLSFSTNPAPSHSRALLMLYLNMKPPSSNNTK